MTSSGDEDRKLILSSPDELGPYLSSKVLFWRVQGCRLPLSPGNLLLALKKNRSQEPAVTSAIAEIEKIIKRKQTAWENKVLVEFNNRITQWKNLVGEFEDESRIDASYRNNVRVRVILTLLNDTLYYQKNSQEIILKDLDDRTRSLTVHGNFLWECELSPQFPEEKFWFLYIKV